MPTPLDRIIPLYRKRVLQRAKENEAALRASGAYSPAEFNDLIGQLQERYGIDQADVDALVDAINQTFVGGEDVGEAMADQSIPEFEPEEGEEDY